MGAFLFDDGKRFQVKRGQAVSRPTVIALSSPARAQPGLAWHRYVRRL